MKQRSTWQMRRKNFCKWSEASSTNKSSGRTFTWSALTAGRKPQDRKGVPRFLLPGCHNNCGIVGAVCDRALPCCRIGRKRGHRPRLQFLLLLDIDICAGVQEFHALLIHRFLHFFGDFHRAELRTAHAAEVRQLRAVLRQGFVVEIFCGRWIEAEVELVFPAEFESSLTERVVPLLSAGMAFCEIRGMSSNLVCDDAVLDILLIRQPQVFFRRDVAEHRRAVPADHGGADRARDVIVAGSNVRGKWAKGVK